MSENEDEELWVHMMQDVEKIQHNQTLASDSEGKKPPKNPKRTASQKRVLPSIDTPKHAGDGLDRKTAEKLRKGQMPINGRLDLHGMTQAQAYEALNVFIPASYGAGKRCVLVITGKGAGPDGRRDPLSQGQGVLKRMVPEWLGESSLVSMILKTEKARPQHGGDGALYVLLRRRRS